MIFKLLVLRANDLLKIGLRLTYFVSVFGFSCAAFANIKPEVDLLMVLAVDVSSSVSMKDSNQPDSVDEYELQKQGIIQVLEDRDIGDILERCNTNGVALSYMEWSDARHQEGSVERIPWTHIKTRQDLEALANQFRKVTRNPWAGSTDMVSALLNAKDLIENSPYRSNRRVIALSGDGAHSFEGYNNPPSTTPGMPYERFAQSVRRTRDEVVRTGIIIDALVIMNEAHIGHEPLDEYFDKYVVGGTNHILIPVQSYAEYAEGLKEKLMKELNNCLL